MNTVKLAEKVFGDKASPMTLLEEKILRYMEKKKIQILLVKEKTRDED